MKPQTAKLHERDPRWLLHYRIPNGRIPGELLGWLLDSSSLTRRLQGLCGSGFHVQVVSQGWARPMRNEAQALGMRSGQYALVRQVRLMCNDRPWVFARTVIPRRTLSGKQRRLAGLGSKPLGAMLFADPGMTRGEMELAQIRPGQRLFPQATEGMKKTPVDIWGRRSLFYLAGKPLLVSEIFIPGILPCGQRPLWGVS